VCGHAVIVEESLRRVIGSPNCCRASRVDPEEEGHVRLQDHVKGRSRATPGPPLSSKSLRSGRGAQRCQVSAPVRAHTADSASGSATIVAGSLCSPDVLDPLLAFPRCRGSTRGADDGLSSRCHRRGSGPAGARPGAPRHAPWRAVVPPGPEGRVTSRRPRPPRSRSADRRGRVRARSSSSVQLRGRRARPVTTPVYRVAESSVKGTP